VLNRKARACSERDQRIIDSILPEKMITQYLRSEIFLDIEKPTSKATPPDSMREEPICGAQTRTALANDSVSK